MPQLFVHGRIFAYELQKAFGIERGIRSIKIDANVREVSSVTIEFVASPEEVIAVGDVMRKYHLVSVDNDKMSELLGKQFVQVEDGVMYVNGVKVAENCK